MRLAVVSPFVDRRHGTERAVAELLMRLANRDELEIHLYAQRVSDLDVARPAKSSQQRGSIIWHRVPAVPGPHLVQFVCWFFLNRFCRAWDRAVHGLRLDVVFSPGINCSDADVILVHAVFHRLAELATLSSVSGLRGLHQRLYYRLLCFLEKRTYSNPRVTLAAVSRRTALLVGRILGRNDVRVIWNGVDPVQFSVPARLAMRTQAREKWHFSTEDCVLLIVGNDWRIKGLPALMRAVAACRSLPLHILVVGSDQREPYERLADALGIRRRVHFSGPSDDPLNFFAASDIYASPTREDAFALPPLEAMACGLPVITSACNGGSEIITVGVDGIVLHDPADVDLLARTLRELCQDPALRGAIGQAAERCAAKFGWDRNATEMEALLSRAFASKKRLEAADRRD